MSYNFKSIANVEIVETPTDKANVLIEENGVIKKAPKTAVGGANKASDEVDFEFTITTYPFSGDIYAEDIVITKGSMDNVLQRIRNDELPKVKAIVNYKHGENGCIAIINDVYIDWYGSHYDFMFILSYYRFCIKFNEFGEFEGAGRNSLTIEW